MPDYEGLYFQMFRAVEQAIRVLIQAQQACEELYLKQSETVPLREVPKPEEENETEEEH